MMRMKTILFLSKRKWFFAFLLLLLIGEGKSYAQVSCSSTTPTFTVDLSSSADASWTSSSVTRKGQCCTVASTYNCVLFKVTLNADATGVQINITSGGTGTTYYENSCDSSTLQLTGQQMCLSGTGPFNLTICKPGNNPMIFKITSIPKPRLVKDIVYATDNCPATLQVKALQTSTVTWTSLSGSRYDSCLSCKSGCDSITFNTIKNMPTYVDYKVCGTPTSTCLTGTWCDTVRVYYVKPVGVTVSPHKTYMCTAGASTTITATISNGKAPYTYSWNTGASTSSITVTSAGSYICSVKDSFGCNTVRDTSLIILSSKPVPSITGNTSVCEDEIDQYFDSDPGYTYSWSASGGTIVGLNTNPEAIIKWGTPGSGSITLTKTSTTSGCSDSKTVSVTIKPKPSTSKIYH